MSIDSSIGPTGNEWTAFSQFVQTKLGEELDGLSLEESVAEFRAYQRDLEKLRAKVQHSLAQADRGASRPLDDTSFWSKMNHRFDELGLPE